MSNRSKEICIKNIIIIEILNWIIKRLSLFTEAFCGFFLNLFVGGILYDYNILL